MELDLLLDFEEKLDQLKALVGAQRRSIENLTRSRETWMQRALVAEDDAKMYRRMALKQQEVLEC